MSTILSLPTFSATRPYTVALVGNPNTGKTTLFNALTGFRQRVGNYPGVTVEKKSGPLRDGRNGQRIELFDLPGTYSLTANAADEDITLQVLLGYQPGTPRPDAVLSVVDAATLRRNLFLVSQVLELGLPVVVALTRIDIAQRHGLNVDTQRLSELLGVPVVGVIAHRGVGLDELSRTLREALHSPCSSHCLKFPDCICSALDHLTGESCRTTDGDSTGHHPCRAELLQSLLNPSGIAEGHLSQRCDPRLISAIQRHRDNVRRAGVELTAVEAEVRYRWIDDVVSRVVRIDPAARRSRSDIADTALAHPLWGLLFFAFVMLVVFQAIFTWASPIMDATAGLFAMLGDKVRSFMPDGALRSLLADGVIAGVGSVLVFLPQIVILFLFIAVLEDCGYLARAAFVLDRHLRRLGLSGRSFIPLMSSFACAVPAIMACRVIEDRRDRLVTVLIAPLMSCSARLPVYALMISAFVPRVKWFGGWLDSAAVTLLAMYLIGVCVAVGVAWLLNVVLKRRGASTFLMELPDYSWPRAKTVFFRAYQAGKDFIVNAGTVIFACSLVIWALAYYPKLSGPAGTETVAAEVENPGNAEPISTDDSSHAGAHLRQSYLGRAGRFLEPVFEPLGWDWRIGTAVIASFPAREVVVATLGTIFNLDGQVDETSPELRAALARATWPDGRPLFSLPAALSLMVFFALCCQCVSTLAVIRRETLSWRWPAVTFVYMTALAYLAAWATFLLASRLI